MLHLLASDSPEVPARLKQFGTFTLDTLNECLWQGGVRIALPPKPFAVLRYLVEHPGRLVSHDELLDALWPETYVQPQILRTYMLDLRKVLEDDARNPRFIQSLPKRGYCFIAAVTEAHAATISAPETVSIANSPSSALVGRERELATLHAARRTAEGGTRQVLFITGEGGIGKTALVDAFRAQTEPTLNGIVAHGQCIPGLGGKQEYYPLADAFRCGTGSALAEAVCRILHNSARRPVEGGASTDPSSAAIPGELCAALEDLAREKTLVLILEDLQWADESTLAVISALARRRGQAKLLILASAAPQTGSICESVTRIKLDLAMRRLCCEIPLGRLPRPAVASLVRARLRQDALPTGLHEFVFEHSEGNPRFVLAMLEHLIEEKILVSVDDSGEQLWDLRKPLEQADATTPCELARMIELEIQHLSPDEQQLLEAGSLGSVAFPAWMVAAALGRDLASTEEACDALAQRLSFVKRAGEDDLPDGTRSSFYVFAHAMFREVLYQRQSAARRAARHVRVAERLRAIFYGRDELIARDAAAHYEAAGDCANAIAMLRIALRRAMNMQAFGEAAELHERIACLEARMHPSEKRDGATDVYDDLMWSRDSDNAHQPRSNSAKA